MMNKFRLAWIEKIEKKLVDDDGFSGLLQSIVERGGRFYNWHKLTMPGSEAEVDLDNFSRIACIFPEHQYCKIFLEWANEAADRALIDDRFNIDPEINRPIKFEGALAARGWKIEGVYPGNHGQTLSAACLSRALRDDSELNQADLLRAANEIVETALHGGSSMWDYMAQSWYLRSVRLCLVANRVDKAQLLLKNIRRKFKPTFVHQQWLQALCNAIYAAGEGPLTNESAEQFQVYFDEFFWIITEYC